MFEAEKAAEVFFERQWGKGEEENPSNQDYLAGSFMNVCGDGESYVESWRRLGSMECGANRSGAHDVVCPFLVS